MPIVIPPEPLQSAFSGVMEPFFDLSENLQIRNANLRATRDLLLPKLISGEVSVENINAEAEVEALA